MLVEAGSPHKLPSTVLGSLKDDLQRVLDDPEAVFASVEAGFLHELPSTVLGSHKDDLRRVLDDPGVILRRLRLDPFTNFPQRYLVLF